MKLSPATSKSKAKSKGIDKVTIILAVLLIPLYALGMWLELNPIRECKIFVDGKTISAETRKFTVKELLAQEKISLGALDKIEPKLNTKLEIRQEIKISRVDVRRVDSDKDIPYQVVIKKDQNLLEGTKKVVAIGRKGTKVETYEITSVDGVDKKVELVKSKELVPPQNQLVAFGTKKKVIVNKNNNLSRGRSRSVPVLSRGVRTGRVIYLESTAYTHTGNRTATGVWPNKGIVAVDPRVIPLGTKLYVEGYGYAIAADTGGAIKGGIIDVFFNSYSECINWGRRKVRVEIIK